MMKRFLVGVMLLIMTAFSGAANASLFLKSSGDQWNPAVADLQNSYNQGGNSNDYSRFFNVLNSRFTLDGSTSTEILNTTKPQPGIPGSKGDKGDKGDTGAAGKDGVNGSDGKDGLDGKDGVNGKDGKDGATGAKGDKGDTGATGAAGARRWWCAGRRQCARTLAPGCRCAPRRAPMQPVPIAAGRSDTARPARARSAGRSGTGSGCHPSAGW